MLENDISTHLGKKSKYVTVYSPSLLVPIPRALNRHSLSPDVKFCGIDIWNCYEVSWLSSTKKPEVAVLEVIIPAGTTNLPESKSLKLYLNSFNNTVFENVALVQRTIESDLHSLLGANIKCRLFSIHAIGHFELQAGFEGAHLIDTMDVICDDALPNKDLLRASSGEVVAEKLFSNLLRSTCPITSQPDWASILIEYIGPKICHKSLLKYIVSYRDHSGFGEDCVERIFCDISQECKPSKLLVYARYTRRGGIDINPLRSSHDSYNSTNIRLIRQ